MASALLQLQLVAQPQTRYVLAEQQSNPAEDADADDPADPLQHLHRQAAKIRRGEKLDRLTAIRKPGR